MCQNVLIQVSHLLCPNDMKEEIISNNFWTFFPDHSNLNNIFKNKLDNKIAIEGLCILGIAVLTNINAHNDF